MPRPDRRCAERTSCLVDHDYDRTIDVRVEANGLLEWASNKPAHHAAVRA